jgi:hypothetical protein
MPPQFRLRPGSVSDLNHAVRLYDACLGSDKLVQLLFSGKRDSDPVAFKTHLYRLYAKRFWSVEWMFTFIVKEAAGEEAEEVVGFSCWKRPAGEIGFAERWLSICESSSSLHLRIIVFLWFYGSCDCFDEICIIGALLAQQLHASHLSA